MTVRLLWKFKLHWDWGVDWLFTFTAAVYNLVQISNPVNPPYELTGPRRAHRGPQQVLTVGGYAFERGPRRRAAARSLPSSAECAR